MSRHRSFAAHRPKTLVELALEQAPSQGRGAHRSPTPEPRPRGRAVAAAVAAGAVTVTGTGAASADTATVPTSTTTFPAASPVPASQTAPSAQTAQQQPDQPVVVLQWGSEGPMVRELQWVLNQWYPSLTPLAVDGSYGPKTAARVKHLQRRAGIEVDGAAGPQTFDVLNFPVAEWARDGQVPEGLVDAVQQAADQQEQSGAPLDQGSRGEMVRELQRVLNEWYPSMDPLDVDGSYGPTTASRVRRLQQRAGIEVDGVAGPQTLDVLNFPGTEENDGGSTGGGLLDAAQEAVEEATGQAEGSAESDPEQAAAESSDSAEVLMPTTGTITSGYGSRWGSFHYGLDIANSIGTPVYATKDGVVIESGPASGFGLWIRVRHPNDTISVYGHIHDSLVSAGERVSAGEQIATMGSRGYSTGPHLHFEIWQDGGEKIDPAAWLENHGVDVY